VTEVAKRRIDGQDNENDRIERNLGQENAGRKTMDPAAVNRACFPWYKAYSFSAFIRIRVFEFVLKVQRPHAL
jgi:hypothetical protein